VKDGSYVGHNIVFPHRREMELKKRQSLFRDPAVEKYKRHPPSFPRTCVEECHLRRK
jgi:hypothetical protein